MFARAGLRTQTRQPSNADAVAVAALRRLRQDSADLFQSKPAHARNLSGIAQEIDPSIRIARAMTSHELSAVDANERFALHMPCHSADRCGQRKTSIRVEKGSPDLAGRVRTSVAAFPDSEYRCRRR